MTFIIPMAGRGSRFLKEGFTLPKYMIEVKGKTLFEYSLESLPLEIADKIIFVCLEEHDNFNVSDFIKKKTKHNNIEIIKLKEITRGQAETVYKCKDLVSSDDQLLIYNIDTAFNSEKLKQILLDDSLKKDGILGAFIDKSPDEKWSFASLDNDRNIIKTTEKEKISNFALTGLYHFSKASDFFDTAKDWIENQKTVRNEFYIAPMYNDLVNQGKKYTIDIVDEFIPLGTPQEVKEFESKN
jgi:NDP-sugar pyrophosphorylase family protein